MFICTPNHTHQFTYLVYIVMCAYPLYVVVLLCTFLNNIMHSTVVQCLYLKPRTSRASIKAVVYSHLVSWAPRLTLLDLGTNWTYKLALAGNSFVCRGLTVVKYWKDFRNTVISSPRRQIEGSRASLSCQRNLVSNHCILAILSGIQNSKSFKFTKSFFSKFTKS